MGSETEPAKLLLPYLQRADELQKVEPLVAYYCRLYAADRGLKIPQQERTKTTKSLLVSLMNQLEKDKKSLNFGPDDNLYVEGFASKLFAKADKQDRDGRADLNTAKTFYAASIFFEILNQFGELHPDIEQKQKYAIWKAADIRKALKEGRKPEPGPPGGDKDLAMPSSTPASTYDLGPTVSFSNNQQGGVLPSQHEIKNFVRGESFSASYHSADASSQHTDNTSMQDSSQTPIARSSYPTEYTGNDFHQPTPTSRNAYSTQTSRPEYSAYPQQYDHQSYSNEQPQMHHNYLSPENPSPSYSYPNFQSYPSFQDSTFTAAPPHQPSYYHGPDAAAFSHQPDSTSTYMPTVQYSSSSHTGNHVLTAAPSTPSAESYKYDSSYQPSAEKIAEAHKAARFAVGALAFDDVSTAVDFLRRSLDLLINPSAETH